MCMRARSHVCNTSLAASLVLLLVTSILSSPCRFHSSAKASLHVHAKKMRALLGGLGKVARARRVTEYRDKHSKAKNSITADAPGRETPYRALCARRAAGLRCPPPLKIKRGIPSVRPSHSPHTVRAATGLGLLFPSCARRRSSTTTRCGLRMQQPARPRPRAVAVAQHLADVSPYLFDVLDIFFFDSSNPFQLQ